MPFATPAWATVLVSAALFATATAKPFLNIITTDITQCGDVKFSYGGGTAPYTFTAAIAMNPAQTMSLNSDKGEAQWKNIFPQFTNERANKVVFFLEDATKSFSVSSPAYTISTNVTGPCAGVSPPPFFFRWKDPQPPESLAECDEVTLVVFNSKSGALPPLPFSYVGVIPGGDVWRDPAADGNVEKRITLNIEAGNEVLFIVQDRDRNQGGASTFKNIIRKQVGQATCLNANSHRGPQSLTKKGVNAGMIAGSVVGSVLGAILIAAGGYLFWRKKNTAHRKGMAGPNFAIEEAPAAPFTGSYTDDATSNRDRDEKNRKAAAMSSMYSSNPTSYTGTLYAPTSYEPTAYTAATSSSGGDDFGVYGDRRVSTVHSTAPPTMTKSGRIPQNVEATYRVQDDAGPVNMAPAPALAPSPIIDMPPTYNPNWSSGPPPGASVPGSGSSNSGAPSSVPITRVLVSEKSSVCLPPPPS